MSTLKYTHAVVCRIPKTYGSDIQNDYPRAKFQHECYVKALRDTGIDVVELPADEAFPMCAFVEDTAVCCNGIALITRPGNHSRLKEAEIIKTVLRKELDLPVIDIADKSATLDGGDVLFTGKEFFVGVGKYSNEAGARAVAAAFPEYPCTPIKITENYHLKSLMSIAGPDIICVGSGKTPQDVLNRIKREATYSYQTLTVPEDFAANVLYVNGTLFHRTEKEIPLSFKIFNEKMDCYRQPLDVSELERKSCGITSCCLLIRRSRHCKIF
ncbi:hypothetical protein PGB90_005943 [Kerria lacca]